MAITLKGFLMIPVAVFLSVCCGLDAEGFMDNTQEREGKNGQRKKKVSDNVGGA